MGHRSFSHRSSDLLSCYAHSSYRRYVVSSYRPAPTRKTFITVSYLPTLASCWTTSKTPFNLHHFSGHNNSLSMYLSLDSEQQLGKLNGLNNQAMKVLVNKAFKIYYLTSSAWNFLQHPIQVHRSATTP